MVNDSGQRATGRTHPQARSLVISLLVGSAVILINHGDALLKGEWPRGLAWMAPLTYIVSNLFVAAVGVTWTAARQSEK